MTRAGHALRIEPASLLLPKRARSSIAAKSAKQVGHRLGIAGRAEHGLHSRCRDRRKEVAQIHAQNNTLSDVRRCECPNRTAAAKPVHRRMNRDSLENLRENLLLHLLQSFLRRFNERDSPPFLRQYPVVIMTEWASVVLLSQTSHFAPEIGEPR